MMGYDAYQTVNDPDATEADKTLAVRRVCGRAWPTRFRIRNRWPKQLKNAIGKADDIGDAAKTAKGGTYVLKDKETGEVVYCGQSCDLARRRRRTCQTSCEGTV